MNTLTKYICFAFIATLINICVQFVFFNLYQGLFDIYFGLFLGTIAGLIIKYILDKKYIFYYKSENKKEESKQFFFYSLMGIVTTLVFWGFEIGFYYLFENENAKYIGGVIGLTIGYVLKYFLDKKYVFNQNNNINTDGVII